jgi:hypothetical protein
LTSPVGESSADLRAPTVSRTSHAPNPPTGAGLGPIRQIPLQARANRSGLTAEIRAWGSRCCSARTSPAGYKSNRAFPFSPALIGASRSCSPTCSMGQARGNEDSPPPLRLATYRTKTGPCRWSGWTSMMRGGSPGHQYGVRPSGTARCRAGAASLPPSHAMSWAGFCASLTPV